MEETLQGISPIPRPRRKQPQEWKLISLRECPTPEQMQRSETPEGALEYWRAHVIQHPYFSPEVECFVVLHLNTRRRIRGHHLGSIGLIDSVVVHAREEFRTAIAANASALVLMHNLCAQAHKLCYVTRPFMCSSRLPVPTLFRVPPRKVCCA